MSKQGDFENAIQVVSTGLALAPEDASLLHNRKVFWGEWADVLAAEGDDEKALSVLRRAAKEVSDGRFFERQAWIYTRRGESQIDAEEWSQALAIVEPGLAKVDEAARDELRDWRDNFYLRWAAAELRQKSFKKAIEILATGLKNSPDDSRLANNVVFTTQEWARHAVVEHGEHHAIAMLQNQIQEFPKIAGIRDVANRHARRVFIERRDAGQLEQALAAIDAHRSLLVDDDEVIELQQNAFDSRARTFMKQRNWSDAVDVYEAGLRRLPENSHLQRNLVYATQEWSRDVLSKAGTAEAKRTLLEQIKRFPDLAGLGDVAASHTRRVVHQVLDRGEFEAAVGLVEDHKVLLASEDKAKTLLHAVFDRWAAARGKSEGSQAAIDVYTSGLQLLPGDTHLLRNAVATWHTCARPHIDNHEWPAAIEIYEKALQQFPDNGTLQNNLRYCQQHITE